MDGLSVLRRSVMRCGVLTVAAGVAVLFLVSDPSRAQTAKADATDPVVAVVNGTEIRESDLRFAEQDTGGQLLPPDEMVKRDYLLKLLIDINLLSQAATTEHIAEDDELRRRTSFVRKKVLTEKLMQVTAQKAVTEKALRDAYNEMVQKLPQEPELHLRAIVFKFSDANDAAAVDAAKAKAEDALQRIKKGEEFDAVAVAVSKGQAENAISADLGYQTRGAMGAEYAEVAFALPMGGVSSPIKTSFGWHIIKLDDKRMRAARDFESTRDSFQQHLGRKAQIDLIQKLRSEADIKYIKAESPQEPAKLAK